MREICHMVFYTKVNKSSCHRQFSGDTLAREIVCKYIKNKIKTPVQPWIPEPFHYVQ